MGCTGFTNGGIPEGRSVLYGRVVASDNPQNGLAGVIVTAYTTPTGEPTSAYRVYTDAQGNFTISGIATGKMPVGSQPSSSNVTVNVNPSPNPYLTQQVNLHLTANRPASVLLATPPQGFDFTKVGGVKVTVQTDISNPPPAGTPITLSAVLLDHSGNPLISPTTQRAYIPDLVLDGLTIDKIDSDGTVEMVAGDQVAATITGTLSVTDNTAAVISTPVTVPIAPKQPVLVKGKQTK